MDTLQLDFREDDPIVPQLKATFGDDTTLVKADQFEGDVNIVSAFITLTSLALPAIGLIVRERIASKRHIKVKYKGITIQGESLERIDSFLSKLIESQSGKKERSARKLKNAKDLPKQ